MALVLTSALFAFALIGAIAVLVDCWRENRRLIIAALTGRFERIVQSAASRRLRGVVTRVEAAPPEQWRAAA